MTFLITIFLLAFSMAFTIMILYAILSLTLGVMSKRIIYLLEIGCICVKITIAKDCIGIINLQ